ncbi:MAG: glycosyltransferase [Eubacteriales bacterium]|nr:glycosyltransferase [Eubacteriales bacterium]
MKKMAFVVQRYGAEVNGGAETLAREMVEHLSSDFDVEVLTTKAADYITWENSYQNDIDCINGIKVRRFDVPNPRNIKKFIKCSNSVIENPKHTLEQEKEWFNLQGPFVPALIQFISEHSDDYDVFVFMTYLYYTTVKGLPKVAEKSVLIPTAHDEPPIYLKTFEKIFKMPKGIFYLTHEEQEFVEKKFHNADIINNGGVGGSGVDVPVSTNKNFISDKYGVTEYILYAGRIDVSKGCKELFRFFLRYKRHNRNNVKLVMIGRPVIRIPRSKNILSLGFVSEQEKYDIMSGAKLLIMPSEFESLSIVVLEALALGVPVMCNGKCHVLKGHCERSKAGETYTDYSEFENVMNKMTAAGYITEQLKANAVSYIKNNYTWDIIINKFKDVVKGVIG